MIEWLENTDKEFSRNTGIESAIIRCAFDDGTTIEYNILLTCGSVSLTGREEISYDDVHRIYKAQQVYEKLIFEFDLLNQNNILFTTRKI